MGENSSLTPSQNTNRVSKNEQGSGKQTPSLKSNTQSGNGQQESNNTFNPSVSMHSVDITALIEQQSKEIAKFLTGWESPAIQRFKTSAVNLWNGLKIKTPVIASQFIPCLLAMAELKLLPSANQQFAYFIPYGEKLELQIGVRGFVELASRVGLTISTQIAYANDNFEVDYGENKIVHKPKIGGNRGDFIAVWGKVIQHGQAVIEVVEKEEIDYIRKNLSKSPDSPAWKNFYGEMAKKIVIKRLLKRVSISGEMATAIELDNDNYSFKNEKEDSKQKTYPQLTGEDSIEVKITKRLAELGVNPNNLNKQEATKVKEILCSLFKVDVKVKEDLERLYDTINTKESGEIVNNLVLEVQSERTFA